MEHFMILQNRPEISVLLAVMISLVLLYLVRSQAHKSIRAFCRVISNAMRLAAASVVNAEKKLAQRNREVLLASGMKEIESELEREFQRVEAVVQRDLQVYPSFHRKMDDLVTKIDEDYANSTEAPPLPPPWISAVQAFAEVPADKDGGVAMILGEIHKTLEHQQKSALEEYRKSSATRHGLLKKIMPFCRQLSKSLEKVGKTITGLEERAKIIDEKMADYEQIRANSETAVRKLSSSSLTQFVIAGLVMLIAIGGAVINFNLIALPMSEMVGGGSYIGPHKTSDVAALVIILVELSMGLFLMESLRITHLFPLISNMDDRLRTRMLWISFSLLFVLAGVESSLAFMRDRIASDMEALRQSLAGAELAATSARSLIPTIGQMVLGFVLPFALTFVAIPLESFIQSSRTVLGICAMGFLRLMAFVLRLIGNVAHYFGKILVSLYDLVIAPFLWVEKKIVREHRTEIKMSPKEEVSQ
ncbi:MAG: hypothetical protein JXK94_09910 [Deltaproteobacteria bacterium]|nr:hypothetical protein [Deltaproteobacteria bacterium]